jgi:hypothetical protein
MVRDRQPRRRARQPEEAKTGRRSAFRCGASAIKGRFDLEFETGPPLYAKFGAVLTRRELLDLINCLKLSLGESSEHQNAR